jgi:leader peptidase (prepilin peptidase) / N-methyltransferase
VTFVLIFIFGLFVGSFLNVLVDRLPRDESVVKGRSHCEKCKENLAWYDLIPLFSFLQLRGKCRYCHSPLSQYYPTVELTTGILFVITALFVLKSPQFTIFNLQFSINYQLVNFQLLISLIYYLFIVSSLIVVFFADLKYGIIPDKVTFSAIIISLIYIIFNTSYIIPILSAVGACLFFLILALIKIRKRSAMGFGDVKFAFLMGLILGFPNIVVALYVAFLTGAIVGIILIIWRRKKIIGTSIPFGPFLVFGTLLALFWGNVIIQKAIPFLGLL